MNKIATWWSSWQGEIRSVMRIVAAAMFMLAGTSKLFAFPIGMPPNGQTATFGTQIWIGAVLEVFGGLLMLLGLFSRPVALHPLRRDGRRLLPVPPAAGLLAHGERRRRSGALLLPLALLLGRRPRPLEPRRRPPLVAAVSQPEAVSAIGRPVLPSRAER